jgi:hypothetical protein
MEPSLMVNRKIQIFPTPETVEMAHYTPPEYFSLTFYFLNIFKPRGDTRRGIAVFGGTV